MTLKRRILESTDEVTLGVVEAIGKHTIDIRSGKTVSTIEVLLPDVKDYDLHKNSQLPVLVDKETREILKVYSPDSREVLYVQKEPYKSSKK